MVLTSLSIIATKRNLRTKKTNGEIRSFFLSWASIHRKRHEDYCLKYNKTARQRRAENSKIIVLILPLWFFLHKKPSRRITAKTVIPTLSKTKNVEFNPILLDFLMI
jgi:hypothetical protein